MAKILAFEVEVGGVKEIVDDLDTLKSAIKQTNQELQDGPKIGSREYNKLQKQLGALKEIQKEVRADTRTQGREFVISADAGKRSYRALSAELSNLRAEFKELSEADRNSDLGQSIISNIRELDSELKEIDASIGLFQRNVGNYRQALIGLGDVVTGGLITGGLQEVFRQVVDFGKEAVDVTAEFGRQIGLLGQVSGAAFQTIEVEGRGAVNALVLLEEKALELGSTTEFSASQVAELEIAYAKLGFTPVQILDLLSSTIDTATVSGSELGRTAEVIGTTLRAFNLEAAEGGRVADVLAKAFASSSLDISKFETAVATVGASANAVGLSLEEVTALLAVLTDSGFDASTAATSLRNIFIENSAKGLTLSEALLEVEQATNSLVTANDEYGKRGAAQAVVLATQTEKTAELTDTLKEAAGFSQESATVIRDDLRGALDSVVSATEALQLALIGTFGEGLKGLINDFADFLRAITSIVSGTGEWADTIDNISQTIRNFIPAMVAFTAAIVAGNSAILVQAITAIPTLIAGYGRAVISSNIFKAAQIALNVVLRANPVGLIVTAIGLLIGGLVTAYQRSEEFRASIAGLGAVASEIFSVIKEAVGSFVQGFEQLKEGNISEGLKSFGEGIVKSNPIGIALTQGERLKEAFNTGYNDKLLEDRNKAERENTLSKIGEDGSKITEDAGKEIGDGLTQGINESTAKSITALKARKNELEKEFENLDPTSDRFSEVSNEIIEITAEIDKLSGAVKSIDVPGPFDQLNQNLNEIKAQIQDAIVTGEDYSDLLLRYQELSDDAAKAQGEFKESVEAFINVSRLAEGSIAILNAEVKDLKSELEDATPGEVQALTEELIRAELKLQDAKNEIERARLVASGGPSTGVLGIDIEDDLRNINTVRQERLSALLLSELDEQDVADKRRQINLESDIEILEARTRLFKEDTEERLKLENDLAQKRKELQDLDVSSNLNTEINDINTRRDAQILALERVEDEEKNFQAQRKVLDLEATVDILRTRLELENLTNQERLALQVQLADSEVALEKAKNAEILESRRVLNEQSAANIGFALNSVSSAIDSIQQIQDASTQRRLNNINEYYAREISLAEGNDEEIERLETERDERLREVQEEQFERQKRMQIAQALISGAQAIVSTLAAPPGPADILSLGAIRAIQIGLVAATTAAQIATISAQSFHKGGFTGNGKGKPDETGHIPVGKVHANEYVVPTKVLTTKEGRALVDRLEDMRLGINRDKLYKGYSGESSVTGGFTAANIQPDIPNIGGYAKISTVANMSEASIDLLADRLEGKIGQAVKLGIIEGMNNNNRMHERKKAMLKSSRI